MKTFRNILIIITIFLILWKIDRWFLGGIFSNLFNGTPINYNFPIKKEWISMQFLTILDWINYPALLYGIVKEKGELCFFVYAFSFLVAVWDGLSFIGQLMTGTYEYLGFDPMINLSMVTLSMVCIAWCNMRETEKEEVIEI